MARTGAENQERMWAKFAKGAAQLGKLFDYFRPVGQNNPLDPANLIGTLPVALSADDLAFRGPLLHGKSTWKGMWDGRLTAVGDYLVGPSGTYFIAAQQMLLPPVAIECNATVSIMRPRASDRLDDEYRGVDVDDEVIASTWPCSLLATGRGNHGDAGLPSDVSMAGFQALLPAIPGITLRSSDTVTDNQDRRFTVSSAELTDLGWRLNVMLTVT